MKKTQVGLIPHDWEAVQLGKLLRRAPTYGINAAAVSFDSRLPTYLRITDITEDGRFAEATKASVKHPDAPSYRLELHDLVVARTGASVGKSYRYDPEDGDLVFAGFLIRLSPDPERLEARFLAYFLQSAPYWNWVRINSMRSGQPGINGREYATLPIPLPPTKAEQDAIAGALSDADALIESLEQLLVKKRRIKQGAMQELLTGKKRVPGFATKHGFKQTEAGSIPEDWLIKSLDEIASVTSGKRLPLGHSLTEHETPHPYIRVTDMRPGTVSLSDIKFVPVNVFPRIRRYRIFKEDLFISVAGTLGIVGKIPPALDGANLTENADRITNITCSQEYLLHVMMAPPIQSTIESLQTIGAQPKLALMRIRKFSIPLPPSKAEQIAIAETISDMDAEIDVLEAKLSKARDLKQGMMQELLTGRIRLT